MNEPVPGTTPAFVEIDGFRCYAPAVALDSADYPSEGFDVTVAVEERSFWCRTRNRILHSVLDRFAPRGRRLQLLEVGCGTGNVLSSLRHRSELSLTGSEIYLSGLRHARRRHQGIDFIQLDATDIPFREDYDIVGAFDVIEHIEADDVVLAQVRSALRPGGLLLVTVPQYQWMWSSLDELVHHKRRYSRTELRSKLVAAGFDVLYTTSFVTALFPVMAIQRGLNRFRTSANDTTQDFAAQVVLPGPVNTVFDWIMRVDEAAIRLGLSLPFGGSLLAVARRNA